MSKNLIILFFLFYFFTSCEKTKPNGYTGDLITLTAKNPDNIKSLKYKWTISEKPENSKLEMKEMTFSDDKSSLSFIPDFEGHYSFRVSLSWYGEIISIQSFPLEIAEGGQNKPEIKTEKPPPPSTSWTEEDKLWLDDSIKEPEPKKPIHPSKTDKHESPVYTPPKESNYYTIQVAAKKDKKSAEKFMKKMQGNGFSAYIQRYNKEKSNELWYRIRVGSFTSKDSAKTVADKIRNSMNLNSWIDYVRKTKE
ncbi:MAG: SPOR domain-containing protein [Candidatus Marinimicrobia bacterium]|jgi:hypothetical protein|nr:SPOR domain-containing protein [Candidatus Neomarinimicrobiota bacterium]